MYDPAAVLKISIPVTSSTQPNGFYYFADANTQYAFDQYITQLASNGSIFYNGTTLAATSGTLYNYYVTLIQIPLAFVVISVNVCPVENVPDIIVIEISFSFPGHTTVPVAPDTACTTFSLLAKVPVLVVIVILAV